MIAANFEYHRPATLREALSLLSSHADDAKILAGGQSPVPVMKFRLAQPKHLVDISRIRDLRFIREEGDTIVIGAMNTHHDIGASDLQKSKLPILTEAANHAADGQDPLGDIHASVEFRTHLAKVNAKRAIARAAKAA